MWDLGFFDHLYLFFVIATLSIFVQVNLFYAVKNIVGGYLEAYRSFYEVNPGIRESNQETE